MTKAIIFDCFGVLTSDTWQEFLNSLPNTADVDAIREIHRAYDANLISKQQCADEIKKIAGKAFTEIDDIKQGEVSKNRKLLDYIKTLKPKYKVAIASNIASNWIRESFLTKKEQALFNEMFLSFEIGAIKPSSGFFDYIFKNLDLRPNQVVLIDDKQRYCDEAKRQGMQAIVYQNFEQMKTDLEKLLAKP